MIRSVFVGCLVLAAAAGVSGADDTRGARLTSPVALTPYAPACAYLAPANDGAVVPAGGRRTPPSSVVPAAGVSPETVPAAPGGYDPVSRIPNAEYESGARGWVRAEYLLWSVQSSGTPALVVADAVGTARTAVGLPGTAGQRVLFGNGGLNGDLRSGFRVSAGRWLGDDGQWGVSGDFFLLASEGSAGAFSSPGNPPLSRPFFNAAFGRPDAELVSFPGILSGTASVSAQNTFVGAGAFVHRNLCMSDPCDPCGRGYRFDFVTGYRYLGLNDQLNIREDLQNVGQPGVAPGTRIVVSDRFRTQNQFHGGLVGLNGEVSRGRWVVDGRVGVSLGNLRRELTIAGDTTVTPPGGVSGVRTGGLLAQPTNIGRYTSDVFTAVPELGLNVGYQITDGLRVHVGYTLIYLPNTWRAGDQIDLAVDTRQLMGMPAAVGRPAPRFASTGAAVQGVNFGLTLRY